MDKNDSNMNLKTSPVIIKLCSVSKKENEANMKDTTLNNSLLSPNKVKRVKVKLFSGKEDELHKLFPQMILLKSNVDSGRLKIEENSKKVDSPVKNEPFKIEPVVFEKEKKSPIIRLSKLSNRKLNIVYGGDGPSNESRLTKPFIMQLSNLSSLPSCSDSNLILHQEIPNSNLEPARKKLKVSDVESNLIHEKSECPLVKKTNISCLSENMLHLVHTETSPVKAEIIKPPLVMQSSNLLSDNVLDVRHGGGGVESSEPEHSSTSRPSSYCDHEYGESTEPKIYTETEKDFKMFDDKNDDSYESPAKNQQLPPTYDCITESLPSEVDHRKLKLNKPHSIIHSDFLPTINADEMPAKDEINLNKSHQLSSSISLPFEVETIKLISQISPLDRQSDPKLDESDSKSEIKISNSHQSSPSEKEELIKEKEQTEPSITKVCLSECVSNIDEESKKSPLDTEESNRSPNQLINVSEGVQSDDSCSNLMDSQMGCDDSMMEFDILDEFESNENDPEETNSDEETEISADEIDAMLDAGLGEYGKRVGNDSDLQHEEKQKIILKVRGRDHFDVLPEGWIEVTHNSGMPIYLHKQSRVCCVSKPYFLGPGSTRKHEIPLSAIPCLHYLKQLEKEKEEAENEYGNVNHTSTSESKNDTAENKSDILETSIIKDTAEEALSLNTIEDSLQSLNTGNEIAVSNTTSKLSEHSNVPNLIFPSAKLESVKDIKLSGSLDYLAVREYCQKRFEFQTIIVKRFKTWSGRRLHQKQMRRKQRPFLPDNTQLITCPLPSSADKSTTIGNVSKREFIMNPTGKSPVCILHEYVQHTLRVQPKYIFKELESASTPYGAVVIINDMEYGTGYGSSKKVAKSEAAKSALEVLIPKIKKFAPERNSDDDELQDVEFFDQVRVEDPRVSDLSVKAGQPYPYQILLECLKRNYGMGDTEVIIVMNNLKHQKNEFIMKVGKHKATVVCKNKRDGKHRASQSILQQLHPHINSWGSLLRMYGKGSCKTLKEKKEEEQRITELQSKACVNKPNMSILNKLKEEMLKYREKMKSKKPIGKLIPERMQFLSVSDSNLKSIEL